ncbi:hypothetical protein ACWGI0_22105 [Streptomyces sp. NPDC054802]
MFPLDEVLLDGLAIAAAAVVEPYGPARTTMADPALVELAISADSDEAARARALRLLGFAGDRPAHVVAVRSRLPLDRIGGLVCPAGPVKAAPLAGVGVILATTLDPERFPAGVRAGIGAPEAPTGPGGRPGPPSASPPSANPSSATPTWAGCSAPGEVGGGDLAYGLCDSGAAKSSARSPKRARAPPLRLRTPASAQGGAGRGGAGR